MSCVYPGVVHTDGPGGIDRPINNSLNNDGSVYFISCVYPGVVHTDGPGGMGQKGGAGGGAGHQAPEEVRPRSRPGRPHARGRTQAPCQDAGVLL